MSCICPSCGYNLAADEIVERDGWELDPRGFARFEGRPLRISPARVQILVALARAGGRLLSTEAILSRVSDSDEPNTVASLISQMRRSLRAIGVPDPIETVWKHGYRWRAAA